MTNAARVVLCCCAFATACAAEDPGQLPSDALPGPARSSAGASSAALPGATVPRQETDAEYCAGHGPPAGLRLPGTPAASANCDDGIASQVFQHGFCSCSDAIFTGGFSIDALDSGAPGRPASASVGVNDELAVTGVADIAGSLIVAGRGLSPITSGGFHVDGNLETNSDLSITGANIDFGRDVWVNGGIAVLGLSRVDGDVYQTPGNTMVGMTIGGQLFQRDFKIAKPCACAANEVLDVEAIVEAGIAQNHSSAAGAKPGALFQLGVGGTQELGCGRFTFGPTTILGVTTLKVRGRTALFIDGDFTITGGFGIDVGGSGELDVFVSGNLFITGVGTIGSRERPAAVRFYVGGSGSIALTGAQVFAANLYAPYADVSVTGAQDLWGSLFVGSYFATGAQRMHYDAAVLRSGSSGKTCDTPADRCKLDLDCRSPLVCAAGSCKSLGPD